MKLEDLTVKKLKKFISSKELSAEGNKKELCETILKYVEQKVIQEIEICWNANFQPQEEDMMNVTEGLEKGIKRFIKSHEDEKMRILQSYDDLKIKKQKLKERIEQQKQTVSNLPNIIRFIVGQKVSIPRSLIKKYTNSMWYTLISSNQFRPAEVSQNKYYLNCSEDEILNVLDLIRTENQHIENPSLFTKWGFAPNQYSDSECLELDNAVIDEGDTNDYQQFKELIENQLKSQTDLLDSNFHNYETQLDKLKELVYDDPINLNVGGKIFTISKSKLEKHENTYFSPLISGNWTLENNTHFIDRSFKHFHIIYDYLVNCELVNVDQYFNSLNQTNEKLFLSELDYYQLNKLTDNLTTFSQSKLLDQEEAEYVESLYPGKWKLIPKEQITDTIQNTTVIVFKIKEHDDPNLIGKYSAFTENSIDLLNKDWITFDSLNKNERGTTIDWRFDHISLKERLTEARFSDRYEIYEKIV